MIRSRVLLAVAGTGLATVLVVLGILVHGAYGRARPHPVSGTCQGAAFQLRMFLDDDALVSYVLTIKDPHRSSWRVEVLGFRPNIAVVRVRPTSKGALRSSHAIADLDGGRTHRIRFGPVGSARSCSAAATAPGSVIDELVAPTSGA